MDVNGDSGDRLVSEVAAAMGALTPDEQAAVYGAGYAYPAEVPMPPETAAWIATMLRDLRAGPCRFCHHALLEHTLAVTEAGPSLECDADHVARAAWVWHAGPQPQPGWRILLGVALWVGIPLATVGLAGWVMPLVSAFMYRQRRWALGAAGWGALTVVVVVLIETEFVSSIMGFLALLMWFGSAIYGGFQLKPWLASVARR